MAFKKLSLHSHPASGACGQETKDPLDIEIQETEENLDLLIAELEEEDGKEPDPEVLTIGPGADRPISSSLLQIDLSQGLSDAEVISARRKYGMNRMKEKRRNNIVKFLMLFVGPVQFVMEASCFP